MSKVDIVENISVEDFEAKYLNAEKPVLIKNYTKEWKALNWTLESMKEKAGHNEVFVRRNTAQESYKIGQKYNIQSMKFANYIDNLMKGNEASRTSYLAVQNIGRALPELSKDIEVPTYVKKLHGGPFLWLARKGHYEFCHFDPDDNFLIVLSGEKRVRLYPAKELINMYPNELGSKGRTIQSRVDCDSPDFKTHPKFNGVECYECTVRSGEMLFFPAFWWHQVTSVEQTISVNMFFGNDGENAYVSKIMSTKQMGCFEYWLLNIVQQNLDKQQFQKVLQYLDGSLKYFLLKQWHEVPTDEQIEKLVALILNYCGLDKMPEKDVRLNHPPPLKIRGLLWRS